MGASETPEWFLHCGCALAGCVVAGKQYEPESQAFRSPMRARARVIQLGPVAQTRRR